MPRLVRQRVPRARSVRRAARWGVEAMESRLLLSAVAWTGAGDGINWTDPNNWDTHALPDSQSDLTINALGNPTIQLASGTQSIYSLASNDPLNVTGGTLAIATSASLSAGMTMAGGTIAGGTLNFSSSAKLTATIFGGTLDGVTINGDIDLTGTKAGLQVVHGLTLNGIATLGGVNYGYMEFDGTQTLGGNATILFNSNDLRNDLYVPNGPAGQIWTLTLAPTVLVHGLSGYVGYDNNLTGGGSPTTSSVVNQGVIDADAMAPGASISVNGANWVNAGTLKAEHGGTLHPLNTWSSSGSLVAAAGSTLLLDGTLTNTSSALALSGAGALELMGGTITGGTLNFTSGAKLTASIFGGTLDGVTINGDIDLTGTKAGLQAVHGLTLNGIATLGGVNYGYMEFDGTQTLGGNATILFNSSDARNDLYVPNGPVGQTWTLTLAPTVTVHGASGYVGFDNNLTGGGSPTTSSIVNQGTIDADNSANGGTISIDGANWVNAGTLEAQNGGTIDPLNTWSSTGALVCGAGSTFLLDGTLDNAGNTLSLSGAGAFSLHGGSITGGTLNFTNGAKLTATIFAGTLNGVTIDGDIDLTADKAGFQAIGGLTLNGAATIGGINYAYIQFVGTQTLGGNGQIVLIDQGISELLVSDTTPGQPATLTIGPGITVHGQGNIGGDPDSILLNTGNIIADSSGKTLVVSVPTFNNQGTATSANGGVLSITSTNTLIVSGGNIQITNGITATSVVITAGDVSFNGTSAVSIQSLTLSGTGVLDGTAPIVLSETGTFSGGSLAGSGTLAVAQAATVTVNGNVVASRQVNNAGTVQLVSGALTLDGGGAQAGSFRIGAGTSLVFGGSQAQTLSAASSVTGAGTFAVQDAAGVKVFGAYDVGATSISGGSLELKPQTQAASIGTLTVRAGTFICGDAGSGAAGRLRPLSLAAGIGGAVSVLTAAVISGGTTLVQPGWTLSVGSGGLTFTGSADSLINLSSDGLTPATLALGGDVTFAGSGGTASIHSIGSGAFPGQVDLGAAQRSFVVNDGSAATDLAILANVTDGAIRTSGPGRTQIGFASSFTRGTTIAGGTLEIDDAGALGTGPIDFAGGTLALGTGAAAIANALTAAPADSISIDVGPSSRQVPGLTLGSALNVTGSAGGSLSAVGAVTFQNDVSINNSVPVTIAGPIAGAFAVSKTGVGTLTLGPGATFHGQALQVIGGTVVLSPSAPPATDTLQSLTILPGARLDIGNSALMIDYGAGPSPTDAIRAYLTTAFTGGGWSGAGLGTSGAVPMLGYVDSADGILPGLPAHTIIVKSTIAGDANLDGKVGFSDLLDLAQHYGQSGATWDKGDMNYDGVVNFSDLLSLAQHYGQTTPAIAAASVGVNTPQSVDVFALKHRRTNR